MRPGKLGRVGGLLLLSLLVCDAGASGPRWATWTGHVIAWKTLQPAYYTDPGDLSVWVKHAAADQLVADAAGAWNVPSSYLVPTYGGSLDEHVSGGNAYLGPDGPVFPADVQSGNFGVKQIAVIYDTDGSVTEMLLGSGTSDPSECPQYGVTGSVDRISGQDIEHALLVLNGRCTGSAPEMQLQMRYQLIRAFGRILGLGWSQNNDNVFTGDPAPTYDQAMNWPIMHPIDLACGPYSYQCLPQPFTLRPDDVSSISMLYGNRAGGNPPGKIAYLQNASAVYGTVSFPNGQGMQGVNVVARRQQEGWAVPEQWTVVSGVTGFRFRQASTEPVSGGGALATAPTGGSLDATLEGAYELSMVELRPGEANQEVLVSTEAINPLYTGSYAVGPDGGSVVSPSGSAMTQLDGFVRHFTYDILPFSASDGATACSTGNDGTETAPADVDASGWWTGVLCGYGHAAWSGMQMAGGRSLTVEITALDEGGFPTTLKAMPVIGVWDAAAATGAGPATQTGIATTTASFNSLSLGMTNLGLVSVQPKGLRIVVADARGDGRPDFAYQARVLYADAIAPANVSSSGGTVTITGMGFRPGNAVLVNGVPAKVTSWSATTIVAVAPTMTAAHGSATVPVDVTVKDLSTGGTTVMTGVLLYGKPAAANVMKLISAPSGNVYVGDVAATPFVVQSLAGDGVTPLAGEAVNFTANQGLIFGACAGGSCVVQTDARGMASTTVSPRVAGAVVLQAGDGAAVQTASFTAVANVLLVSAAQPTAFIAEGGTAAWGIGVVVTRNGAGVAGQTVNWTAGSGVQLASAQSVTNAAGLAPMQATAGPLSGGKQVLISACAWAGVCGSVQVIGVAAADLRANVVNGAGQSVVSSDTLAPVLLEVTDLAGDAVMGATVQVYQTVSAWETACPGQGRCPIATVFESSRTTAVSDAAGHFTVTPLQIPGTAGVTNIGVAVGTQGFVSLSLVKAP